MIITNKEFKINCEGEAVTFQLLFDQEGICSGGYSYNPISGWTGYTQFTDGLEADTETTAILEAIKEYAMSSGCEGIISSMTWKQINKEIIIKHKTYTFKIKLCDVNVDSDEDDVIQGLRISDIYELLQKNISQGRFTVKTHHGDYQYYRNSLGQLVGYGHQYHISDLSEVYLIIDEENLVAYRPRDTYWMEYLDDEEEVVEINTKNYNLQPGDLISFANSDFSYDSGYNCFDRVYEDDYYSYRLRVVFDHEEEDYPGELPAGGSSGNYTYQYYRVVKVLSTVEGDF